MGIVDGQALLDLDYQEDSTAEVDMNVVMTGAAKLVEVQGTAEGEPYTRAQLDDMLELATAGSRRPGGRTGRRDRDAGVRGTVRFILATGNSHKVTEFRQILAPHEVVAMPQGLGAAA